MTAPPLPLEEDGDWYLSSVELQQAVGGSLTTNLSKYRRAIAASTDQIDRWTGRRFLQDAAPSTRTFRALTYWRVCVGDFVDPDDVLVESDDSGDGTWSEWDPSEWTAGVDDDGLGRGAPMGGEPWRWIVSAGTRAFPTVGVLNRVRVTTKWGWASPPQPIIQACMHLSRWNYESTDRLEQVMDGNPFEKAKRVCHDYAVEGGELYCQPMVG